MSRCYNHGDILSPSGLVKIDETCRRGFIDKKIRKKGVCTWCGIVVKKPKRHWCSKECVEKYNLTQPNELKKLVKKRDKTICALCGLKCRVKGNWDLDHKVPIIEGGHPFDMDNLRTLCEECHKKETKELRSRLVKNKTI